jgi:hypothetical protein
MGRVDKLLISVAVLPVSLRYRYSAAATSNLENDLRRYCSLFDTGQTEENTGATTSVGMPTWTLQARRAAR